MTSMRALVARRTGEPSEVVRIETRDRPVPGPGQALVRVLAAPVQPSDLHIIRGRYGFTPEFLVVLGSEAVGVIDELGAGVEGLGRGLPDGPSGSGRVATRGAGTGRGRRPGQSNPEIAQALYVTRKTVETHLGNVYRKLGIAGRGRLAGAMAGMTLTSDDRSP